VEEEEKVEVQIHRSLLRDMYLTPVIAVLAFLMGGTVQKVGDIIDAAHQRRVQNAVLIEGLHQLRISHEQLVNQVTVTQKALLQVEDTIPSRVASNLVQRSEWTSRIDVLCQSVSRLQEQVKLLDVKLSQNKL
jgi:hypothetical protein